MIRLGTPEQFRIVREFLRIHFSEEIVAAALGVASIHDFDQRPEGKPLRDPLVQLFFAGAAVPFGEIRHRLPSGVGQALGELGLLASAQDRIWCPVILYPAYGPHLISDRFTRPDGSPFEADREFVYFALTANTANYIRSLPDTRCESFLDAGAGCGAAALFQSRVAGVSVASDISERSCLFAEFNRRLNAIPNAEIQQGSLYEPVRGRTFSRIGCHPPYDVSGNAPWTIADGGVDGEFVIRGTIAGLPEFLEPGGEFVSLFRAGDRSSQPLEQRIREWLGPANEEFDIAMVVRSTSTVQEYAVSAVISTSGNLEQYQAIQQRFEELEIVSLVYCHLLIRRKRSASAPLTLRRDLGQRCGYAELSWRLDFETELATRDLSILVLEPSPSAQLLVRNRLSAGRLEPLEYKFETTIPFTSSFATPQLPIAIATACDGRLTLAGVMQRLREGGLEIGADQFRAAVVHLLSTGVLRVSKDVSRPRAGE